MAGLVEVDETFIGGLEGNKHIHRCLDDFTGCCNARSQDTVDQMVGTAKGMQGKRLRYRGLVA